MGLSYYIQVDPRFLVGNKLFPGSPVQVFNAHAHCLWKPLSLYSFFSSLSFPGLAPSAPPRPLAPATRAGAAPVLPARAQRRPHRGAHLSTNNKHQERNEDLQG